MRRWVVVTVLALVTALLVVPRVRRFAAIDDCLDLGGRWDYRRDVCDGVDSSR